MAPKDTQSKLVRAAAEAGVPYIMPSTYGLDPLNEAMMTQVVTGISFFHIKKEIEQLGASSWVAFGCSFWYEWSLVGSADRFGCDVGKREMAFFDDGAENITTTTWA